MRETAKYFNRQLSWLAFNRRVLNLCGEKSFPLLEKLRFLAIAANNLDEFFEIRVAGLEQQLESGVIEVDFDGMGPREQLHRISAITSAMISDTCSIWKDSLLPALKKEKIFHKVPRTCSAAEKEWLKEYFETRVLPALTPLAIDPAHPFPHLRNKGLYVLLSIAPENLPRARTSMAVVPVPPILPRIIRISEGVESDFKFFFLSDMLKFFAASLFPGYAVKNSAVFRITRNSDLYFDEEETENLLQTIENELHNRRKGAAVRLEIEKCVSDSQWRSLVAAIDVDPNFVFKIDSAPVNMNRVELLYDMVDRPDLKFPPFKPRIPPEFSRSSDIFETVRAKDRLLHHPYDSFEPVEDFISSAARDPNVLAIKMTLYRTGKNSPIVNSLMEAADNGKQVTVLVELKARFDEEKNIRWARELEEKGVHVVYGIVGLKTHCKTCLIVRNEGNVLRQYAHLGTGNYNSSTAKAYTDLSFFTARADITDEVARLFNTLTGKAVNPKFEKLEVAPFNFHSRFISLVEREAKFARAGKPARIIIKVNSVMEKSSIDALYEASKAGVKIDLFVRGICGLVPQVKGMSENITVRSIVGIYLEHSRIYYFENGGSPEIYAGSADIMTRNMFKRIECMFPIEDPDLRKRITGEIFPILEADNEFSSELHSNGAYYRKIETEKDAPFSAHRKFMEIAKEEEADERSFTVASGFEEGKSPYVKK